MYTKLPIALFVLVVLVSCTDTNKVKALEEELEQCKLHVEELENTPERRLLTADELSANGQDSLAMLAYTDLIEKYPDSDQAGEAQKAIVEISERQQKAKEEADRIAALGYKALTPSTSVTLDSLGLQISFSRIDEAERWILDRYDDRYHYKSAERGEYYITTVAKVTSEGKDPLLPSLEVYVLQDGQLAYQGTMGWEFYRWEDYATYLGNYGDHSNDFSYSSSIRFSLGCTLPDEYKDQEVYLLVSKHGCYVRQKNILNNPPVSYKNGCPDREPTLSVEEVARDYYVVKVL